MSFSSTRRWWPHASLRTSAYWRGRISLFRIVQEATLEFADRLEIYELEPAEQARFEQLGYHELMAELLRRRPDRVEDKLSHHIRLPIEVGLAEDSRTR